MKAIKSILVLMICFYTEANLYSQGINATFPSTANYFTDLKFGNIPVSLYTGVPSINVPLGVLEGKGGVSIPVGLMYHSSGIKVQEIASPVGLGWKLYGGGMVTRVVKGFPDGYKAPPFSNDPTLIMSGLINDAFDSEMDIFYVSLPNGRGFKFFIDPEDFSKGYPIPHEDIDIYINFTQGQSGYPKTIESFIITDEVGTEYFFGGTNYIEKNKIYKEEDGTTEFMFEYDVSWVIKEIKDHKGFQLANFTYENGATTKYKMYSAIKSFEIDGTCTGSRNYSNINTIIETINPKYLEKINSSLGFIDFTYTSGRLDLEGGRRLTKVKMYNTNYELIKDYDFEYSYFEKYANVVADCPAGYYDCFRLKLDKIKLFNKDFRAFDYYEDNIILNDIIFTATRDSPLSDYLGYFRKHNSQEDNHSQERAPIIEHNNNTYNTIDGKRRNPNDGAIYFLLKKMTYPTGAFNEFIYENNTYLNNENIELGAGVRIKEIVDSKDNKRLFTYQNGRRFNTPKMYYIFNISRLGEKCLGEDFACWDDGCSGQVMFIKSESFRDIIDLGGVHIGYDEVIETSPDGSFVKYEFKNFDDYPDLDPINSIYTGTQDTEWTFQYNFSGYSVPFGSTTTNFWKRGSLIFKTIYDDKNKRLQKTEFKYNPNMSFKKSVKNRKAMIMGIEGGDYRVAYSEYSMISTQANLYEVNNYAITSGNEEKLLSSVNYYFDAHYTSLPETIINSIQSTGDFYKIEILYPHDYFMDWETMPSLLPTHSDGLASLYQRHVINIPIEKVYSYKEQFGSYKTYAAELTTYKRNFSFNGAVPHQSFTANLEEPVSSFTKSFINENSYNNFTKSSLYDPQPKAVLEFDDFGNLSTIDTENTNFIKAFEYGHNNTLVTAEVLNPGSSEIRTTYQHKPLVGPLEVEDVNGRKIKYDYDNYYRQYLTKDGDNNILERLRYNIKGDVEMMTATFNSLNNVEIDKNISFSHSGSTGIIGEAKYLWDFGDGTVIEGNSYQQHSYSTPGNYTVKLTLINPEYAPVQSTKVINVVSPKEITLCIDGPQTKDLCGVDDPVFGSCTTDMDQIALTTAKIESIDGGCSGPYTYKWYQRQSGSSFWGSYIDTNDTYGIAYHVGVYEIRCEITDACGMSTFSDIITVNFYTSTFDCPFVIK